MNPIESKVDTASAAARLRLLWGGGTMDDAYGMSLSPEGQRLFCSFDMEALARTYLIEHRADDGELLTEDWLRTVGFGVPPANSKPEGGQS